MVVLAVIGVVGAIAYPMLNSFRGPYNFRAAAREVYLTTMQARSNAIQASSKRWRVEISPPETFALQEETTSLSGVYVTRETLSLGSYGYGIQLLPTGDNTNCGAATTNWNSTTIKQQPTIAFTGRGTGDSGSFFLEDRNNDICYAVSVASNGLVRLHSYNGSWD